MPDPLTTDEIAELVRLEQEIGQLWHRSCVNVGVVAANGDGPCLLKCFGSDTAAHKLAWNIAVMRNATPRLLAEVVRLREESERLKRGLQEICDEMQTRIRPDNTAAIAQSIANEALESE